VRMAGTVPRHKANERGLLVLILNRVPLGGYTSSGVGKR
jgi:hypothetical protein